MGSLTSCIKKAGAALHADDKAAILATAAKLRAEGAKAGDASVQAIQARMGEVAAMIADLERVDAANAEPSADTKAIEQADRDIKDALGDLGSILTKGHRTNITPEQEQALLPVLTRLMDASFRKGYYTFKRAAKFVLDKIREAFGDEAASMITIDHLQGAYIGMAAKYQGQGASTKKEVIAVESLDEVLAVDDAEGTSHVPSPPTDLERDRVEPEAADAPVDADVPVDGPADGPAAPVPATGGRGGGRSGVSGVRAGGAAAGREPGDQPVHRVKRSDLPSLWDAGADEFERGDDDGSGGVLPDRIADEDAEETAVKGLDLAGKLTRQRAAESIPVEPGLDNIRDTLPFLLEGQQEDVHKAETRFAKPDGYGMLFTNGTGTGKTFTGLGIIKRFARRGKGNILIVVPDDKIMADWVKSAQSLMLTVTPLADTKDAGRGITITTYANAGDNNALAHRDWDLVVADEAHQLSMNAAGDPTKALHTVHSLTLHPRGIHERHARLFADELARLAGIKKTIDGNNRIISNPDTMDEVVASLRAENEKLEAERKPLQAKVDKGLADVKAHVAANQLEKRPRLLALSATPFAYERNVDWADGYLFDYEEDYPYDKTSGRYNQPSPHDYFFITHFGYRMRVNKLTEPDARVNRGLMQRQFNGWLRKRGVLSSRQLDVPADYDRRFVLVESVVGNQIDRALDYIAQKTRERHEAIRELDKTNPKHDEVNAWSWINDDLYDRFFGKLGHLNRRYLLEAIKAREVVQHVREHMAMGRKVVVFHDFKKGGSVNPFHFEKKTLPPQAQTNLTPEAYEQAKRRAAAFNIAADEFNAEFPDLAGDLLARLSSPIAVFTREFPNVLLVNGDEKKADLLRRYEAFNDDATGPQVMLVQSDKNKGWSGHDTTGKHQRVLFNLGLPTQPTKAIQTEGRIYRVGQVSDAIMRYLNTGTSWERWAFATTIAERASTAENLAMGEEARALKDAFIEGFEESGDYRAGMQGEGKGGKERDRLANEALTEFDRAKAFYFGTQKKDARTKAQEGVDYFATPEPVGLKMVEFGDVRGGEDTLEPSAGHGAIARWLPENANRTAIEPSTALGSRLALNFDGKIISDTFENLHVANKYDVIEMNPPFGTAGRTAIDHLAKAATHLRDYGRIVAILPEGTAANQKFDKWFYEEAERDLRPLATIDFGMGPTDIYRGDTIKTRASWAAEGTVIRRDDTGTGFFVRVKGSNGDLLVTREAITGHARTGPRKEKYRPGEGLHLTAEIKLPAVTFERAGTAVMARIVVIDKLPKDEQRNPGQVRRDLSDIGDIGQLFDRIETMEVPRRLKEELPDVPEIAKRGAVALEDVQALADAANGAAIPHMKAAVAAFEAGDLAETARTVREARLAAKRTAFETQAANLIGRLDWMLRNQKAADKRKDKEEWVQQQAQKEEARDAGEELAQQHGLNVVSHLTKKGKTIRGVIRTDLSREQAGEIDAYTFSKNGGMFIRLEHLAALLAKYPPPGSVAAEERAVYSVKEPEANYDLFPEDPPQVPAPAGRGGRGRARGQAAPAGDVPAPNALSVRQDPALPGVYHVTAQLVEVGRRDLPVSSIRSWGDAATALSALRRYAVEHFDVLITDKAGKPLAVVGAFKGAPSQASVYPAVILMEALRIEGAARAWGVHNHPSGRSDLSRADEFLSLNLRQVFDPSSVEWMGLAAVGREDWTAVESDQSLVSGPLRPGRAPVSVPIVERTIMPRNVGMSALDSPDAAKRFLVQMAGDKPGLMLLDNQHVPVAWVEVDPDSMRRLREGGGFDRLINSLGEAGASAVIVSNPGQALPPMTLENIASALKLADVRMLDAIDTKTMSSAAAMGTLPSGGLPVTSQAPAAPGAGMTTAAVQAVVDRVTAGWAEDGPTVTVVASSDELPTEQQYALRSMGAFTTARGMMLPGGQVFLIADKLQSEADAQFVLFHEVLGHYGLRTFLGADYDRMMGALRMANPTLAAEANAWYAARAQGTINGLVKGGMTRQQAEARARLIAVEEALADRAGRGDVPKLWHRVMAALQRALRRMGLERVADMLEGMTEAETFALLGNARKAVQAGMPAHVFTGDGASLSTRKSTGRIRRTVDELVAMAEGSASWRDWYDLHQAALDRLFGEDAALFQRILSATSQLNTVKGNVTQALKAYEQMITGQPFTGYLAGVIANLERIRAGEQGLNGPKIGDFERANFGDQSAMAIDRHIAQLLFNTSAPNRRQIAAAKRRIREVANRLGWTPRQAQAALWAANQVRLGTDPAAVVSYDRILEARADRIAAIRARDQRGGRGGVPAGGAAAARAAEDAAGYDAAAAPVLSAIGRFSADEREALRDLESRTPQRAFRSWLDDLIGDEAETKAALADEPLRLDYLRDYLREAHNITVREDGRIEFWKLTPDVRRIVGDRDVVLLHHTASGIDAAVRREGLRPGRKNVNRRSRDAVFLTTEAGGPAVTGYRRAAVQTHGGDEITYEVVAKVSDLQPDPDDEDIKSGQTQFIVDRVPPDRILFGDVPLLSVGPPVPPELASFRRKSGRPQPIPLAKRIQHSLAAARAALSSSDEFWDAFRQGALDQFYGIQRATKRYLDGLPDLDIYVTARLANGATSGVMHALLLHGQAQWNPTRQHLEKKPNTEGLLDILARLGPDLSDWFDWMIANRAERLLREGREKNFTAAEIAAAQAVANTPEKLQKFQRAAREYAAFKRSVLDVAEQAGLIDKEARKAWDFADYIPFYREIDQQAVFSPTGRKGLAGQTSGIRRLKGSEAGLNDPVENIIMNFSRLIDAALKNNAIVRTIAALESVQGLDVVHKVGYDVRPSLVIAKEVKRVLEDHGTPPDIMDVIPEEVFEGISKMWAIVPPADPDVVRIMVGGHPQYYKVNDPLLLRALTSFIPVSFPGLPLMRAAKRMLTRLVTATPTFWARNWVRDSIAAQAITPKNFSPWKSITGIAKSYRESGAAVDMLFAGASFEHGQTNAGDPEGTASNIRRALRSRGVTADGAGAAGKVVDWLARFVDAYEDIGSAIENANREAVYEAAVSMGNARDPATKVRALYEAKDLMDFNLRGSSPIYQVAADVLPFFNARTQGLYRLGRSNRKRLMIVGGLLFAFSMLLAWNNDGEDWYEELPDYEKDLYWHLGPNIKIPKPFELGVLFATLPERIGRAIKGLDTGRKTMDRVWANLRDQLAFDPVPQLIRPAADVAMNRDTFRDRAIENRSDEGVIASERAGAYTSDAARVFSQQVLSPLSAPLESAGLASDAFGLSPKRIEFLVGGYFGTVGTYALAAADMMVRAAEDGPERPATRLDDLPLVGAFYREDPAKGTVFESDLYKMRNEIDDAFKSLRNAMQRGELDKAKSLKERYEDRIKARGAVVSATETLSSLNRQRDAIYRDPKLSAEEKRERLDELQRAKNRVARQAAQSPAVKAAF